MKPPYTVFEIVEMLKTRRGLPATFKNKVRIHWHALLRFHQIVDYTEEFERKVVRRELCCGTCLWGMSPNDSG